MQQILLSALFLLFSKEAVCFNDHNLPNNPSEKSSKSLSVKGPDSGNSPFSLILQHAFRQALDSMQIDCSITAVRDFIAPEALHLQISMEEDQSPNQKQGRSDSKRLAVRTMLSGANLPAEWKKDQTEHLTFIVAIPEHVRDLRNIALMAYLQSGSNQTIYQAAVSPPKPLPNDLIAASVQGLEFINCQNQANPVLVFGNAGTQTLYACRITYRFDQNSTQSFAWTGKLKPGETTATALPSYKLSSGKHSFECSVSDPNGFRDVIRENNAVKIAEFHVVPAVNVLPFNLSFQKNTGIGGSQLPLVFRNNNHDAAKWEIHNGVSSFGRTGKALAMNLSQSEQGAKDECLITAVNLSNVYAPKLSFNYAYLQQSEENADMLEVLASTDCGMTWNSIWSQQGSEMATGQPVGGGLHIPLKKEWKNVEIDLSNIANQSDVILKYVLTSDRGNVFYLDDISISSATVNATTGTDMIVAPNPSAGPFKLTINNAPTGEYMLKVLNTLGQIVYIEVLNLNGGTYTEQINLHHLPTGVYPVVLYNSQGILGQVKQLFVQKA
ncbi:MAG: choice-of-anchor J domain-containing protein [Bacteroidota bacterium]